MTEPCHDCGGCRVRKLHGVGEVACPWCHGSGIEPEPDPVDPEDAERHALWLAEYQRRIALSPEPVTPDEAVEIRSIVEREIAQRTERFWSDVFDPDRARDARKETL